MKSAQEAMLLTGKHKVENAIMAMSRQEMETLMVRRAWKDDAFRDES